MTTINLVATVLVSIAFGASAAFGQEYELVYVGEASTEGYFRPNFVQLRNGTYPSFQL